MPISNDILSLTGPDQYFRWNADAALGTPVTVTYSFKDTVEDYDTRYTDGYMPFSEQHKAYARLAFDAWDDASGIRFLEVKTGGHIKVSMVDMTGEVNAVGNPISGRAYYPRVLEYGDGTKEVIAGGIGGDIFLNADRYASDAETIAPGIRGYTILMHEIGHALGLKHPFSGTPQIVDEHNNGAYTIMAYDRPASTVELGSVDIEATQLVYGLPGAEPVDVAHNTFTTGYLRPGETLEGSFDRSDDRDWYRITLEAGETYAFTFSGDGGAGSGTMSIRDDDGNLLSNVSNSEKFTPGVSDEYFVEASVGSNGGLGDYSLRAVSLTGNVPTDLSAIRDFDGNDTGSASGWKFIGKTDVQLDGDVEFVFVNPLSGRWATVGPDENGNIDFDKYGDGGDTRVVGIYLDPEVEAGRTERFGPFDSQQRFQNDLRIDNLSVIDALDFDGDGFQEIYFKVNDGTAYLRALMHADGNIQYANYQSTEQVEVYITGQGYGQDVLEAFIV